MDASRADRDAADRMSRERRLQDLQQQLPTGWRIEDSADTGVVIFDPAGNDLFIYESLPRDTAALLAQVQQQDAIGRQQGIYPDAANDPAGTASGPAPPRSLELLVRDLGGGGLGEAQRLAWMRQALGEVDHLKAEAAWLATFRRRVHQGAFAAVIGSALLINSVDSADQPILSDDGLRIQIAIVAAGPVWFATSGFWTKPGAKVVLIRSIAWVVGAALFFGAIRAAAGWLFI